MPLLAIVIPALFAAILGYFIFFGRISDVYLGVITLTVTLILFNSVNSTSGDAYKIGRVTFADGTVWTLDDIKGRPVVVNGTEAADTLTGLAGALFVPDDRVFLMGEDIGKHGGAFGVTRTLFDQFGPERIRNTPISENTIVGCAIGSDGGEHMTYDQARDQEQLGKLEAAIGSFINRFNERPNHPNRQTIILFPGGLGSCLVRADIPYHNGAQGHIFDYDTVWLDCSVLTGAALDLELQGFRRSLIAVFGHGDLDFQKLRAQRAQVADEDDDPAAPGPVPAVTPAAPTATRPA